MLRQLRRPLSIQWRSITTTSMCQGTADQYAAARRLLNLTRPVFTSQELRMAYLECAKQTHPDVATSNSSSAMDFVHVTKAYELLQNQEIIVEIDIAEEEQLSYRRACMEWLGQPAEIVEESKRDPAFRQWLLGRSDGAIYWRNFLAMHGGLAPMLSTSEQKQAALPSKGVLRRRR